MNKEYYHTVEPGNLFEQNRSTGRWFSFILSASDRGALMSLDTFFPEHIETVRWKAVPWQPSAYGWTKYE